MSETQIELVNVVKIYSNGVAFAALRSDGTVRAWGRENSMLASWWLHMTCSTTIGGA